MFLSESMMRAFHADRVREIERATRERHLVEPLPDAEDGAHVRRPEAEFSMRGRSVTGRASLSVRRQAGTASGME